MRSIVLAAGLVVALAGSASAKSFVIPHFVEKSGFITNTPYTFDTDLFMVYAPGLGGPGAHVDLYLFDNLGSPMTNQGSAVCNPCAYDLDATKHKVSIRLETELLKLGLLDAPAKTGYAIVTVTNDADNLALNTTIFNSHTSSSDLTTFAMPGVVIGSQGPRVLVAPHFFEPAGSVESQTYSFDNEIDAAYVGGQGGVPGGAGATLEVYLYGDDGNPLKNNGTEVCIPCTTTFGPGLPRKAAIRLENLILARGAFDVSAKSGFAVLLAHGADPDGLAITGLTTNAHSGPNDVAMSELVLAPIVTTPTLAVPAGGSLVRALSAQPNPSRSGTSFTFELARGGDVTFAIFDALGRKVRTLEAGTLAAGPQRANWDGKDEAGGSVPPGVYFGKLGMGDGTSVSKLVVLP